MTFCFTFWTAVKNKQLARTIEVFFYFCRIPLIFCLYPNSSQYCAIIAAWVLEIYEST